jgi:hypothetical protein
LKARSWPKILDVILPVYRGLYYSSDADGLVVMADSDFGPVHSTEHDGPGNAVRKCHLCSLRAALDRARAINKPRPCGKPLQTAIAVAVPEICAWYRHGLDRHVNEVAWSNGLATGKYPYTIEGLKQAVLGKDPVPLEESRRVAVEHARRLAGNLDSLAAAFPNGFGSLLRDLRNW